MDFFSESDPFAVVYVKNAVGDFEEYDRTETIDDEPNPDFKKTINMDSVCSILTLLFLKN